MRMLKRAALPRGAVIYVGPSRLDPTTWIVAILTGLKEKSYNRKTDDMVQLWILVLGKRPDWAARDGDDFAVCGDCPKRHYLDGECYVVRVQAPLSIWKAYHRGSYEDWTGGIRPDALTGRHLRFGADGDPASLPDSVLRRLLGKHLAGHSGYTHQWDLEEIQWLRAYFMASVDTREDALTAQAMGWRTFRAGGEKDEGETHCPADLGLTTCRNCGLCSGQQSGAKPIWLPLHGSYVKQPVWPVDMVTTSQSQSPPNPTNRAGTSLQANGA